MPIKHKPTVLSLFSGCGGLDLGFARAGYNILQAYDHWGPAVENHRKNVSLIGGKAYKRSLALTDCEIELESLPTVDVILGGPPCQGFSFAGKQAIDDPRNFLYLDFKRIVEYLKPKIFLMENVRGLEKMALTDIKKSFQSSGYNVCVDRVRAVDLGIPQRRERIIIVGTRVREKRFQTPHILIGSLFGARNPQNILNVIGDLPKPQRAVKGSIDSQHFLEDHRFLDLSDVEQKFIRHIPNGGYYGDAPRERLLKRLKKIYDEPLKYKSPRLFPKADPYATAQTIPASTSPSIGGVIAPDFIYKAEGIKPVVTADHTIHGVYTAPSPSRRFTPREMARLQGFPDEYLFSGSTSIKTKLIGNAVPVPIGELYANEITSQILN
jgi:DNA (cytosine-5)-methyltransferase 1